MEMRTRVYPLSLLIGGALVALLTSCGGGASSGGGTSTGRLTVTLTGLPSALAGSVLVQSSGSSTTVTTSGVLSNLAPGTYTITPQSVTLRRNVFDGTASATSVTLSAGGSASTSVSYVVEPGDLWLADCSADTLRRFVGSDLESSPSASSTASTSTSCPVGIAFDPGGAMWVTAGRWFSSSGSTFYEYPPTTLTEANPSASHTYTPSGTFPEGVAFDAAGNMWMVLRGSNQVAMYGASSLSGTPTTSAFITNGMDEPRALAFDASGNLWVANMGTTGGTPMINEYLAASLQGSPGAVHPITADLVYPSGLAFDADGNLWVANGDNTVLRYAAAALETGPSASATGLVATSASGLTAYGVAFDVHGNLWVARDGNTTAVLEYLKAGLPTSGSHTLFPNATIAGGMNARLLAFDPPPYNLPISQY